MSETPYKYSISKDFPNQSVNVDTLTVEIESNTEIHVTLSYISVSMDTVIIVFVDELSANEKLALDGVVANHQGNELLAKMQWASANAEQSNPKVEWQSALTLNTEPVPEGVYLVSWYCEIKLEIEDGESEATIRVICDGEEQGHSSWLSDVYTAVSGWAPYSAKIGSAPVISLDFRVLGSGKTAYLRRARIALIPTLES